MHSLKTNRYMTELKGQHKVRNMPTKRLPAIVDRAVSEKITKGRASARCDSVVEKVWKDIGGNLEELMSAEKFGKYKAEVVERT